MSSNDVLLPVRKNILETVASSILLVSPFISKFVVMFFLFFLYEGEVLLSGRFRGLELFEGGGEGLSVHIQRILF